MLCNSDLRSVSCPCYILH